MLAGIFTTAPAIQLVERGGNLRGHSVRMARFGVGELLGREYVRSIVAPAGDDAQSIRPQHADAPGRGARRRCLRSGMGVGVPR